MFVFFMLATNFSKNNDAYTTASHIASNSGTNDFDNWIPITLCWSYTLPGSGRAGNSHRYKVMAKNNGGNFKTLGASMMIQEINA